MSGLRQLHGKMHGSELTARGKPITGTAFEGARERTGAARYARLVGDYFSPPRTRCMLLGRDHSGQQVLHMPTFSPRLDFLPEAQRRLWGELSAVPDEFTLYGGTALALHLGHRKSVDFDFFGSRAIDVTSLETGIPFLAGARIVQRDENTLTAIVDRGAPVKVSFFGAPPVTAKDNALKIASLLDLAGTKASVLQVRAAARDYIDMDALIQLGGVDLPFALAAAQKLYGSSFNPEITLKAL